MATTRIVERLRSRTPVSVATPLSVLVLSSLLGNFLDGILQANLAGILVGGALVLVFAYWIATAVDRLWNMQARGASKGMVISLAVTAVLLGTGIASSALSGSDNQPAQGVVNGVLAPLVAYLAVREFLRLRQAQAALD